MFEYRKNVVVIVVVVVVIVVVVVVVDRSCVQYGIYRYALDRIKKKAVGTFLR